MREPVTFIHSADWQLGMTRRYLSDEAQARFTGDRVATIRTIGDLAEREDAQFIVVAGDVFETPNLSRRDIGRACEAMAEIGRPIFLLPGNHDPLGPGSIWTRRDLTDSLPDSVTVLDGEGPFDVSRDVEIVAVPWRSKDPGRDPVTGILDTLEPTEKTRILVGHGMLDELEPDRDSTNSIDTSALRRAVTEGLVDYVALGDRHICWIDDVTGAVNYSGAHESTSFREPTRGTVLSVRIEDGRVRAERREVGTWLHTELTRELTSAADLDLLREDLAAIWQKDRAIVRTALSGTLSMAAAAELDRLLDDQQQIFAAIFPWERKMSELVIIPDEADEDTLGLSGFAADAMAELRELAEGGSQSANDALRLLYRLGGAR